MEENYANNLSIKREPLQLNPQPAQKLWVAFSFLVIICILGGIFTCFIGFAWWIPITVSVKRKIKSNRPTNGEGVAVLILSIFTVFIIFMPFGIMSGVWLMNNDHYQQRENNWQLSN
ncbi:hypothetical protein [Spiroplasma eriocheiris]|uniref:Transmembrane protein n=1 Tax=Spiroplasma eriocheiris TaxID=315358 RepID=A0A0H3XJU5_9MOLU|nr:hypothetical protein [Spiroplasma eriocheiris]AHF57704.1 hypothetical protein SPE_0576 [Spiroplasma eriocheiris CCTCC M 207170]AKM54156.1 hypothetical protein SERIO_v1c05850 [Spiroplasma eriocheiris]